MKFKDIEKKLKREQESVNVPDVYASVSNAPLNKLLEGETPARAFRKRVAQSLLVAVLVIFIVITIGLSAMWLSSSDNAKAPDCYASVTVESGDDLLRIGVVFGGRNIITTVVEMKNSQINTSPIVSHSSQISDFIEPKANDKVRIELLSANGVRIPDISRIISDELESLYRGVQFEISTVANLADTRRQVSDYITACGGSVDSGASAKTIIEIYASLFK